MIVNTLKSLKEKSNAVHPSLIEEGMANVVTVVNQV